MYSPREIADKIEKLVEKYGKRLNVPIEAKPLDERYLALHVRTQKTGKSVDEKTWIHHTTLLIPMHLSVFMIMVYIGAPRTRFKRQRILGYISLLDTWEYSICASCRISTTIIIDPRTGEHHPVKMGECIGKPECIDRVIKYEKLNLVILPQNTTGIESCRTYGYIPTAKLNKLYFCSTSI